MSDSTPIVLRSPYGERLMRLLEGYHPVATTNSAVLVPEGSSPALTTLRENVEVAVTAARLGLRSLDYCRRTYFAATDKPEGRQGRTQLQYFAEAYAAAKAHMSGLMASLKTTGRPDPGIGVIGADLALERLRPTFFSAQLLYGLGMEYEGHAVSRLILEQLAWAYAVRRSEDAEFVGTCTTTKSISDLNSLDRRAGRLYGSLSRRVHMDYRMHHEILGVKDGQPAVAIAKYSLRDNAKLLLGLADMFGLVWECSQVDYLDELVCVRPASEGGELEADPGREFLRTVETLLEGWPE